MGYTIKIKYSPNKLSPTRSNSKKIDDLCADPSSLLYRDFPLYSVNTTINLKLIEQSNTKITPLPRLTFPRLFTPICKRNPSNYFPTIN